MQFIEKLRKRGHRNKVLFLDNCPMHRANLSQEALYDTDFEVLWNLPYRPDLNAIELVWAIAKR